MTLPATAIEAKSSGSFPQINNLPKATFGPAGWYLRQRGNFTSRSGLSIQISLHGVASLLAEERRLSRCLHPLCNNFYLEAAP